MTVLSYIKHTALSAVYKNIILTDYIIIVSRLFPFKV